jgi:hypothetical protein
MGLRLDFVERLTDRLLFLTISYSLIKCRDNLQLSIILSFKEATTGLDNIMEKRKFASTAKRLLIITFKITILIMAVLWAVGIRFEHLKTLRLLFPEPMELSVQERAEICEQKC